MPTDKPWYTILAATVLCIGFTAAAFWLLAYTEVERSVAFAFLAPALVIVGFITGQAVPSPIANVLARASVAPPPVPAEATNADAQLRQTALPARVGAGSSGGVLGQRRDAAYLAKMEAQRAEADALLADPDVHTPTDQVDGD
jgi:hypothetical protein